MIKILFVCHGNICRSPLAEFIMKDLVHKAGLDAEFQINSAAVSREEMGNPIYPPVVSLMRQHQLPYGDHRSNVIIRSDYGRYDYIVCMDDSNLRYLDRILGGDPEGKVSLLLSHAGEKRGVNDPWYSRDFESCWKDVYTGCTALLQELCEKQ